MERVITGFCTDDDGDWVATLDCGHTQHVRHSPPFTMRNWVTTEEGRNGKLGEALNCVRCDRFELPEHFVAYRRTAEFDENTVPKGFRHDHSTKAGVWARIIVTQGALGYYVDSMGVQMMLSADQSGIVMPQLLHHIEPQGAVRFFVEFYRAPDPDTSA